MGVRWGLVLALLVAPLPASAELDKTAVMDCQRVCLYVWPKIKVPQGWHWAPRDSYRNSAYIILPDARSQAYIYANAISEKGQAATLKGFIADDKATFRKRAGEMHIYALPNLATADRQSLPVVAFDQAEGPLQVIAYGEERDDEGNRFYLTFGLGAESREELEARLPTFKAIIAAYHR